MSVLEYSISTSQLATSSIATQFVYKLTRFDTEIYQSTARRLKMKYLILAILSTLLAQSYGQDQVEAGVPGVNQNVVLLGSNLQSNNNAVWKKLISLAVSIILNLLFI